MWNWFKKETKDELAPSVSMREVAEVLNLDKPLELNITKVLEDPPTVQEIGIATLLGGCSGFAARKVTKTAATLVGIGFMGLQGLAYADLIRINWPRVENLLMKYIDQDGDGKFTKSDVSIGAQRLVHNLGTDVQSMGGFATAFWIGFRAG
jgi:FUN14 domain-containing protein 1